MPDVNVDQVRVIARQVTVPEHYEYPDTRLTIDSGELLYDGDKVKVFLKIFGANNVQRGTDKVIIYRFPKMPLNTNDEILGSLSLSFTECPKPIPVPPDPLK